MKISGVRVECEEVSAVLKTHPVVGDALVTAFESPFGKAREVLERFGVGWGRRWGGERVGSGGVGKGLGGGGGAGHIGPTFWPGHRLNPMVCV